MSKTATVSARIDENVKNGFKLLYNPEGIKESIQNSLESRNLSDLYNEIFAGENKDFTRFDANFIEKQLQQYDTLLAQTLTGTAENYLESLKALYSKITPDDKKILSSISNFSSKEEIEQTLADLPDEGYEAVKTFLEFVKDNIISNLALTLQAVISDFAEKAETSQKEFKAAISGESLKDVTELILKLGNDFSLDDVKQIGGQYLLTTEAAKRYNEKLKAQNKETREDIEEAYNQLKDFEGYKAEDYASFEEPTKILLKAVGVDFEQLEKITDDEDNSKKIALINQQIKSFTGNYDKLLWAILQSELELDKILEDQIKSRYDALIDAVLSGTFKEADFSDLEITSSYILQAFALIPIFE